MTGRKKGVSIGAAMKQRMGDQETTTEREREEVKSQVIPLSDSLQTEQVAALASLITEDDPLESFNTRLPRSLQRRLKIYVATSGTKIQTVLAEALENYLIEKKQ